MMRVAANDYDIDLSLDNRRLACIFKWGNDGIGSVNGGAKWKTIGRIFLVWITTLPLAAAIAGVVMLIGSLVK